MVFERFSIVLENVEGIFYPGQTVIGTVHITNSKAESLKGIQLQCSGSAEVRFPAQHQGGSRTCEFRSAKEHYFDAKFSLYNPGQQVFDLRAGQHQYPFSFVLPNQIPSSFEGSYGCVRYVIRAVAQRPWLKRELECSVKLAVSTKFDLGTIADAALPVNRMKSKTLGFWCCRTGPITAQARIERTGYVPGETIVLNADVENETGLSMRGSKAQFVQIVKYLAEGETKEDTKVLQVYSHSYFTDADVMDSVSFDVPPLPPSTLPYCGIINVSYQVQYIVDPGALSINLVVPLDVVIGTIPFISFAPSAPVVPNVHHQDLNHWVIPGILRGDQPIDASTPPPSYEESVRAKTAEAVAQVH